MSKKQILILVSIFIVIISLFVIFFIVIPNINSSYLLVGDYKLKYGIYEGYEIEYDGDNSIKNKKVLEIIDEDNLKMEDVIYPFSIKNNKIYVYGTEYFNVTSDNKLTLVIGGGIDYEWERKSK